MRLVAHARATAFGMISPSTSMTGVRTRVTTTGARPPSVGRRLHVAADAATMCATVTPIIAVESTRCQRRAGGRGPGAGLERAARGLAGAGEGGGAPAGEGPLGPVDLAGDPPAPPPQKVLGRDGPRGPAVLVHHDRHVELLRLEL